MAGTRAWWIFDKVGLELSSLLHQWDPIGVYGGDAPNPDPGEYDDLVVPLLDQFRHSLSPAALVRALQQVLADDYGLAQGNNVDAFTATARCVILSIASRMGAVSAYLK